MAKPSLNEALLTTGTVGEALCVLVLTHLSRHHFQLSDIENRCAKRFSLWPLNLVHVVLPPPHGVRTDIQIDSSNWSRFRIFARRLPEFLSDPVSQFKHSGFEWTG
jgi:hypothetical protein